MPSDPTNSFLTNLKFSIHYIPPLPKYQKYRKIFVSYIEKQFTKRVQCVSVSLPFCPQAILFPINWKSKAPKWPLSNQDGLFTNLTNQRVRLAGCFSRTLHLFSRSLKQGIGLQRNTFDSLLSSRLDTAMNVFAFTDASIHRLLSRGKAHLLREILDKTFQISYFKSKTGSNYSHFLFTKSYHNYVMKVETKINYWSLFPHVGQRAVGRKQTGTLRVGQ